MPPGDGLGYYNGKAVFVPATAVGDIVKVDVIKEKKRLIIASLAEIESPSPDRTQPSCPHYESCGGCSLMHFSYEYQLALKKQMLQEVLKNNRLALNPKIIPSPREDRFRFRAQLKCQGGIVGFSERRGNRVVEVSNCQTLSQEILEQLDPLKRLGYSQAEFLLLASTIDGQVSASIQQTGPASPLPGFPNTIEEDYGFGTICLSSSGFAQSNPFITRLITKELVENCKNTGAICELYCGSGTFSIPMARQTDTFYGFDFSATAIEMAKNNAQKNGFNHAKFKCVNLDKDISIPPVETIMADPPRKGLSKKVLNAIGRSKAQNLLYVSCNPSTLARDINKLRDSSGFTPVSLTAYDMYCHATHLEAFAVLRRDQG